MTEPRRRLLDAIAEGDTDAVRVLLARDAALASTRDDQGVSALLLARYRADDDLLAALRSAGPPLDVFEAATFGEEAVLSRLLEADPSLAHAWSGDGFTPLHLAAFFGGTAVACLLLDAGADQDAISRNPMEVRPLHSAVAGGQGGTALALIAAGAEPGARQRHGWTPLHGAAENGLAEVVDALLVAGADPTTSTDDGMTALELARRKDRAAIVERLSAAGG